jgi:hypothetical protein
MSMGSKSVAEIQAPGAAFDAAAIREQLDRLVAHPLFSNSKRYPVLLAHTVEQTLKGNASELKERSIGVEVFGRSPTYDSNADPVVRITAGEVRKRLVQYYYDLAHAGELVIELPIGSYVPVFRASDRVAPDRPVEAESPLASLEQPSVAVTTPAEGSAQRVSPRFRWWRIAVFVLAACGLGVGIGMRFQDLRPLGPVDRFWAPLTAGADTATYCLGEPAKDLDASALGSLEGSAGGANAEPLHFRLHQSGLFALADVITLTNTAAVLEARHKAFRVVPASSATFTQLREGPIVLIGAFDNIWTLRVTEKLRFGFESRNGVALIVDRKSPAQTTWATAWDLPYEKLSRDYAIVARIHDNITGQPVMIAAGISEEGTEAAGEILSNPVYLRSLLAKAPANWEEMNVEAVIETQVIGGHPGPPTVLAVETW